jgi:small subunit ribosomal protein S17
MTEKAKLNAPVDSTANQPIQRALRKTRVGIVVSDKMDKTIVVEITEPVRHKLYNKYVRQTRRLMVHDENNECGVGDTVRVMETRPLSKNKFWRLLRVIEKAK